MMIAQHVRVSAMSRSVQCARTTLIVLCAVLFLSGHMYAQCVGQGAQNTVSFDASASLLQATVPTQSYSAGLTERIFHNPTKCGFQNRLTGILINASYDQKDKDGVPNITRNYSAWLRERVMLPGNKASLALNARYLSNTSLGLNLQQVYDLAIGGTHDWSRASMEVNAGPAYVGQHFFGSQPSTRYLAGSVSEYMSVVLSEALKLTISQRGRFVFPLKRGDPSLTQASAEAPVQLNPHWGVKYTINDDFVSNTPPNTKRNYLLTSFGISYTL